MQRLTYALADGVAIAKRNVIKIKRVPDVLVSVLISPIIFVFLFACVFGSSIDIPRGSYREFLIGGVFALTLTFGATWTGTGLADDMQKGIINRFRSLPMARSAVVVGRTASDMIYNVISLVIMAGAGLSVGWRVHNGIGNALLGFGVLLLFAYAISWIMAYVGLMVPSVEVVNNASFMVIFPMTFVANTFVPSDNLPTPLRIFAEWNPVSAVTQAARELFGNLPPGTPEPASWSLQNPVLYTLLWVVVIIAVFAPLAVHRYKRVAAKS